MDANKETCWVITDVLTLTSRDISTNMLASSQLPQAFRFYSLIQPLIIICYILTHSFNQVLISKTTERMSV